MLKKRPIIAFVATTAPARAKKFYADTLGLRLVSEDAFAVVFDAGGTMLRVASVQELHPAGYTVLGWIVPSIRLALQDLMSRGVKFRRFDGLAQDEKGIWTSPSGARIAWFEDPDGNTLSLTEFEKRPKRLSRKVRSKSQRKRGR
jgi:catechol 2,3-dioxygenase-like lactoylglutathione lyase family enzyme